MAGILELTALSKMLEFWKGNFGISPSFEDTRILEGKFEISPTFEDTRILEIEFWNWWAVLAQAWGGLIPKFQNSYAEP